MKIDDLKIFKNKLVFCRMKDGFIKYLYIEEICDDGTIKAKNRSDKPDLFSNEEVINMRELNYGERAKFMQMHTTGGF